jgi:hypothetical protein
MSVELLVLVYMSFQRHCGVYYYSIIATTIGTILQTTGFILLRFENDWPPIFVFVMSKVGWAVNVTGFSVVLWSRLHLVVNNPRILKGVLFMIVFDGTICLGATSIFEFGLSNSKYRTTFYPAINIIERTQQTVFTVQEIVISFIYIYYTAQFLGSGYAMHTRKVIRLLLCVQVIVITLDLVLTATVYMDKLILRCTLHPFFYTVKLKLEFILLNQLQTLFKHNSAPEQILHVLDSQLHGSLPPMKKSPWKPREPDFITVADMVNQPPGSNLEVSDSLKSGRKEIGGMRSKSDQTLQDKRWTCHQPGKHDCEKNTTDSIDIFYLGKWDEEARV